MEFRKLNLEIIISVGYVPSYFWKTSSCGMGLYVMVYMSQESVADIKCQEALSKVELYNSLSSSVFIMFFSIHLD